MFNFKKVVTCKTAQRETYERYQDFIGECIDKIYDTVQEIIEAQSAIEVLPIGTDRDAEIATLNNLKCGLRNIMTQYDDLRKTMIQFFNKHHEEINAPICGSEYPDPKKFKTSTEQVRFGIRVYKSKLAKHF